MNDQIRVLLVDDQDLIRTGFRLILLGEGRELIEPRQVGGGQ